MQCQELYEISGFFQENKNVNIQIFIVCVYLLEDLWESLESASGKPIAAMMNTWTKQMGFPLIYVEAEQVNL